ncbi:penicillin-binding protein [Flavobacterium sp. 316]|uniref:serine hydrolase domain-containing protein n=1 Tax=Flavobacterium sp. 316 TaxID=1603293 RepID=UPI0005E7087C|nr:serine hydrolase domain-containing protein [Flavobacterium sp. 316]KIX22592.1 penicillin-binding protein [Flavobacterium sp. 316]
MHSNFRSVLLIFIISTTFFSCQEKKIKNIAPINKINSTINYIPSFLNLDKDYSKLKQTEIKHFYDTNINIDNFSGSFLVAKNGKIIFEDYQGFSNYNKKEKISASTPLHLASVSKVMTASVILRLIDDHKLKLNTTLKSIFPEFPYKDITIESLLNHRSGLANYAYFSENDSIWDKTKTLKNTDILSLLSTKNIKLDFTPNTKFSYCNTNYALLALVIEKISKQSFPEAMNKLLFEPIGMKNTFVFELNKQKDTISKSYKSTWQEIPFDHLDAIYGDKNIYSTPQDILQFDLATYSNTFLSKEIKELAYKGYSYEKKGVKNYGLGIRLNEWDDYTTLYYHNGWWHGNTSAYITLKKDTVTMIALSNKYTRKVYQTKRLSSLFGNYPFEVEEE